MRCGASPSADPGRWTAVDSGRIPYPAGVTEYFHTRFLQIGYLGHCRTLLAQSALPPTRST
ncbi:hypothetical protein ACFL1R_08030 [Candidatus Latescibacterota bacterium]